MSTYTSYSDEQLLVLLKESDELAFRTLYDRYKVSVSRYIINVLRNDADARDIVQELFLYLWSKRDDVNIQSFRAWIYAVARHLCLKNISQANKQQQLITRLAGMNHSTDDTAGQVEARDAGFRIQAVVAAMPDRMQAAFTMSRSEGISHAEVGSKLGMSENTVKKHVQNALRLIRQELSASILLIASITFPF